MDAVAQPPQNVSANVNGPSGPSPIQELVWKFPSYQVTKLIGIGGMGHVYKARHQQLGRFAAIKLLPAEHGEKAEYAEMFRREAQSMAQLKHPHIVDIYDFGNQDGQHYIIMEYVDWSNLDQLIQTSAVNHSNALPLFIQICRGIEYAHSRGIVHCDIKPCNILLNREGTAKVTDFGLAKLFKQGKYLTTNVGGDLGTPEYAAPERMRKGAPRDHRVDVYALGIMLYEMLTGDVPRGSFPPASTIVESDRRLDPVIHKCIEHDPEKRYESVSELLSNLKEIQSRPMRRLNHGKQGKTHALNRCPTPSETESVAAAEHVSNRLELMKERARNRRNIWLAVGITSLVFGLLFALLWMTMKSS